MRIAYDAKRFFQNRSGLGNYSRDLIRIMAKYFPENEYFLLNKKSSPLGKNILQFPSVFFKEVKGFLARQRVMGIRAQEIHGEIYHGLSGELPLWWKKKPIKKIVTIHDLIFERYPHYYSYFDRKIHFWKFKNAAKQADKVIAISEQTKKDIIHFLKIKEDKIEVIYQGCHPSFKQKNSKEQLLEIANKYCLPENFLLSVGTIEPRKNLHRVVSALKNKSIPLIVIGKKQNRYFKKVEKVIQKYNVDVRFLEVETMEELASIFQLATVFIYASEFEGFGIPVIEALFSETAVIASNTSSIPEAGGDSACYVNPLDEKDIEAKIDFLWNSPSERLRRIEKGKIYVQQFQDERIAEQWERLYKNVLNKS